MDGLGHLRCRGCFDNIDRPTVGHPDRGTLFLFGVAETGRLGESEENDFLAG